MKQPKKILIITYYWIPSGGAGVQRWVKFVKYLRHYNIEPIIYTPSNPEYPSTDLSMGKDIPEDIEIIKRPIWEPYNIYKNIFGKKGEKISAGFISQSKKAGWKEKLSVWIRGNFLIPDPRRFWIRPSIKFLEKYITENDITHIISTGPPHSMHLIGYGLKKRVPSVKWIADFRDPWTNIDFYKELHLTPFADAIHHKMEKRVIQNADSVIVVSNEMMKEFAHFSPKNLTLITNGYDLEDTITTEPITLDSKFSIAHIGTMNSARNPKNLWRVLGEMCSKNIDFAKNLEIKLIGSVDFSVLELIESEGLTPQLHRVEYMTHNEAIMAQQQSQLLLLLINNSPNAKGILTGKLFEYLASGRPILAIGATDGDVAKVLKDTHAGTIAEYDDTVAIKEQISHYYSLYQNGQLTAHTKDIERYSRKELTRELSNLLEKIRQ